MCKKYAYILLVAGLCTGVGCGPSQHGGDDDVLGDDAGMDPVDASEGVEADAFEPPVIDANMSVYPDAKESGDAGCVGAMCMSPLPQGCGMTEVCSNGSDDNCNGTVDENCPCQPGSVQQCFEGPPGSRMHGACVDGQQTCQGSGEFGHWGPCVGGIKPSAEACDSVDNDCNGCTDDDPSCCMVDLMCPTSMPEGAPFVDYPINGAMFFAGTVTNWKWEVIGGPCDQLLSPNVSYTLNGTKTTMVSGAGLSTLTFHPTLSGDYTVTVTMTLPDGSTQQCTFIVHIGGPGLRIEMCWDKTGTTDIDLHLHKPGTTTPWFTTDGTAGGTLNKDDCHYRNCKAEAHFIPILCPGIFCPCPGPSCDAADFGYADSPIAECSGSPEGATWAMYGKCSNPRLDIDNINTVGIPENINVDNPKNNQTYRVMVHYYGGSTTTVHPMVNVYCGGHLQATYGQTPDLVPGFDHPGADAAGDMWRVVDVTPMVNGAGATTGCTLAPLHAPGMVSGYYVTDNVDTY